MSCPRPCLITSLAVLAMVLFGSRPAADPETTTQARPFVQDHGKRIRPLDVAGNLAWGKANTTGKDEDVKVKEDTQNKIDEALSDPKRFAQLKALEDKRT